MTGSHADVDIADAVSQASMKKDANPEASAIDDKTNDGERERKEKTSSMKGESERKRQNGSNRQQREAGIRTASQRTAQTGQ
jgi:spore germination cell wall hydrolase CwlJ-like protein